MRHPKLLAAFAIGFASGAVYLASCGQDTDALANVTAQKITRVQASGTTATCPSGAYVVGGGCVDNGSCTNPEVKYSHPTPTTGASNAWHCEINCDTDTGTGTPDTITFALCASATPADALTAE